MSTLFPIGVDVRGSLKPQYKDILTYPALEFLATLHRRFDNTRLDLLQRRKIVAERIARGDYPTFLPETRSIREGDWKCAEIPSDLEDRRVEITGPTSRKMVINAMNSGAKVFMADFEDANSPTWDNNVEGQINLRDVVLGTISYESGDKVYKLNKGGRVKGAPELVSGSTVLMVRPRGLHLPEFHMVVDGRPIAGAFFDFGLFFFHNFRNLLAKGSGPYFYLPKLESHLEARLWNDVFQFSEHHFKLLNVIRATVLIETITAAFEMEEILYEMRTHSAGLNCGRWDYIFSVIKKFISEKTFVLGDRSGVGMTAPFMDAYVRLLIKTCHKRGCHAMGGMAAQIPIKGNPEDNHTAMEKVRLDKLKEVVAGHDGTWVAHPGLIPVVLEVWNPKMKEKNQIRHMARDDVIVTEKDLLNIPSGGKITLNGLTLNCRVSLLYLEGWLKGNGCIPVCLSLTFLPPSITRASSLFSIVLLGTECGNVLISDGGAEGAGNGPSPPHPSNLNF
eukprot:TRINITY_DN2644_c0_g2_i2.p1 TRINITY_DN2644_c0_g2~~TRINITY_DN2644_c0_g2_i2.p1  ORF type:complete len:505 (-),score=103.28 TRINITY_DN2644_c0_g2_i2:46-1560(-)